MDRHLLSEEVTAEQVARIHQEDIKIEHVFNCKGLTYWFDAKRKTAFCLIEAPDKDSIVRMHDEAHGGVPTRIIEVDELIVASFLGRIEDPDKSPHTELNIINDPAFRIIMAAKIQALSLINIKAETVSAIIRNYNQLVMRTVNKYEGNIVNQKKNSALTSFNSVSNAVLCAHTIQTEFQEINGRSGSGLKLNMGLSAGVPVTEEDGFFEATIKMAERLCYVHKDRITISSEVRDLFENENITFSDDRGYIDSFDENDEEFFTLLMNFIEKEWTNTTLTADDFSKSLGCSKSQLYRKILAITGKSPNRFIKDYRLEKALNLLNKRKFNINTVAFDTGFNSPGYFSKCFQESFGVLPSTYAKPQPTNS